MRLLLGLLYALAGAIVGAGAGFLGAMAIAKATNASDREGAIGYAAVAVGILGAVGGIAVGIWLYARTAPEGQAAAYAWSAVYGVAGIVGAVALATWGWLNLMERPVEYGDAQASLLLEIRIDSREIPSDATERWLDVEVQTSKTRPQGTVSWSSRRTEGTSTIIPVIQGPLYRAARRVIVVNIGERQTEVFIPPIKRVPDPLADWSPWHRPQRVDPPYGVTPPAPLTSIVELRYRVQKHGGIVGEP